MLRAKDAITNLPVNAGEDFSYGEEDEDFEDAEGGEDGGPSSSVSLPLWLNFQNASASVIYAEIQRQATAIISASNASSSLTSITTTLASQALDNLKLHIYQSLFFKQEVDNLNSSIVSVKTAVKAQIDEKLPNKVVSSLSSSNKSHDKLIERLDGTDTRMKYLDGRMHEMLRVQTGLLQHLLIASGVSVQRPPSLDANKNGEMEPLPSPTELVARIPPPYYTLAEQTVRKKRDSIKEKTDQL